MMRIRSGYLMGMVMDIPHRLMALNLDAGAVGSHGHGEVRDAINVSECTLGRFDEHAARKRRRNREWRDRWRLRSPPRPTDGPAG
jgi:hypothetical protein